MPGEHCFSVWGSDASIRQEGGHTSCHLLLSPAMGVVCLLRKSPVDYWGVGWLNRGRGARGPVIRSGATVLRSMGVLIIEQRKDRPANQIYFLK